MPSFFQRKDEGEKEKKNLCSFVFVWEDHEDIGFLYLTYVCVVVQSSYGVVL